MYPSLDSEQSLEHLDHSSRRARMEHSRDVQEAVTESGRGDVDDILAIEDSSETLSERLSQTADAAQETLHGHDYESILDVRDFPDTRMFVTFPLLTRTERYYIDERGNRKYVAKKCDVPVVCFGIDARTMEGGVVDVQVIVEDQNETHYHTLTGIPLSKAQSMIVDFAQNLRDRSGGTQIELSTWVRRTQEFLTNQSLSFDHREEVVPTYSSLLESGPQNPGNLLTPTAQDEKRAIEDWLTRAFASRVDTDIDQGLERMVEIELDGKAFQILLSGQMAFLLQNVPTLDLVDAAIAEGILDPSVHDQFVSLEQEQQNIQATKAQYLEDGDVTGQKDLRQNDYWRNAEATYEYDPVRGLYYLDIAGEPVMDEFERGYIQMLGANAAKYGGAVLEIGFGMGISAAAIQEELSKHHTAEEPCVHIIVEYNKDIASQAREWARHQQVPVLILEGDWRQKIDQIPHGVLSGSLSDPYPLSPEEKHKDAALALGTIHDLLRPGGVSVHYSDSQYCLSDEHRAIAEAAGFKYVGSTTASFGKHHNTGEYYSEGMRMMVPALYKEGGTGDDTVEQLDLVEGKKSDLLKMLFQRLFIENPSAFRRMLSLDPGQASDVMELAA